MIWKSRGKLQLLSSASLLRVSDLLVLEKTRFREPAINTHFYVKLLRGTRSRGQSLRSGLGVAT